VIDGMVLSISPATLTFVPNSNEMSAGIIVIFAYMLLGFWLLTFLALWIPLMATLLFMERFSPELGEKLAALIIPRD